jgi:hypothetical protein
VHEESIGYEFDVYKTETDVSFETMVWKKGESGNPGGPTIAMRKAYRSLALWIRDGVDVAELRDRLLQMARGIDPAKGEPIPVADQQRAIQMLFDRGWGQAAAHVIVEADIRNEVIANSPTRERPKLTLEEINERRARLRELGIKPKVIDAESTEQKALPRANPTDE